LIETFPDAARAATTTWMQTRIHVPGDRMTEQ